MAISKDKKQQLVADLNELLSDAKMTVFAKYQGLTVAEMQELRKAARENNVKIKIVKNRLVRVAMGNIAVYKDTDTSALEGQLLYVFLCFGAIGGVGGIPKIEVPLTGHHPPQMPQHAEPAHAGIEYGDVIVFGVHGCHLLEIRNWVCSIYFIKSHTRLQRFHDIFLPCLRRAACMGNEARRGSLPA